MTTPVESYLRELVRIHSSGAAVEETSYYPALSNLLNEIGKEIKPQVTCIMNLANRGAGFPDGGLFTQDQFQGESAGESMLRLLPARGVIEVKGTGDDAFLTAEGEQVCRYWEKYNQVLVTNLRDFVLVGKNAEGRQEKLESFRLAESERAFWVAASTPRKTAKKLGNRLVEFIKRVMLHSVSLTDPRDVAWFLASYAGEAKFRLESKDLPALSGLRTELEESVGLKFEGRKGSAFFRSALVQTLFYGIFSAWVLWSKQSPIADTEARFHWRQAAWSLHFPMIRELFEQVASPSKLGSLQIDEILDWTEDVLNRIEQEAFFEKFEERRAVRYFYEPFLEAFDPELRKELGVWYTPHEIVEYMVDRVDTVLKEELGIRNGLADDRVYVLDPACGTGSYIIEILIRIARNLRENVGDALIANDLKRAALDRILGFEILPAPFVVAHLQINLLLHSFGASLSETRNERVGVYLTNALTGWELPEGPQRRLVFPEFEKEREGSDRVKRKTPILVVLGNPPYNAFAGVSPTEELGLVEPYKEGLISEWKIRKFNLDDLYIRFFRLAERRIAEQSGKGVICYISNFSYLGEPSFVVMRKRLLTEFDKFWIDCLNGSSRETGKRTPDGKPDPSVFSTKYNREGIRVGTAISLLVRRSKRGKTPVVRFRHFWGVKKREELLKSLEMKRFDDAYDTVSPSPEFRYSLRPIGAPDHYRNWPTVLDLCQEHPFNGPIERRGNSLISFESDKAKLEIIEDYLNPRVSHDMVRALAPRLMKSSGEFEAEKARNSILRKGIRYNTEKIVRYPFKPMDLRVAYLDSDIQPLFSRPSPDLLRLRDIPYNAFLITRDTADKYPEGSPFYFSSLVCDYDSLSGHARHFPIWIFAEKQATLLGKKNANNSFEANLSSGARAYLKTMGVKDLDSDLESAAMLWMHLLAIGYSPAYLKENVDGIRAGWPRLPLPNSARALRTSAQLGRQVATLLDTENSVAGVTTGIIRPELRLIARISHTYGGALDPDAGDLQITAGWGHGKNVVMPGKGKVSERGYTEKEIDMFQQGSRELELGLEDVLGLLGEGAVDVYLNDIAYWRNVPARVWEYTIGGYQIIKKWLSYREFSVLGRSITAEEAREVTNIAKRIAALLLLERSLDANYKKVRDNAYIWPSTGMHA